MNWLLYPFIALIFFGFSDLFIKLSAGKINDALGGFLVNFFSALPLILFLIYFSSQGQKIFETKPGGVIFSIISGLLIGVGTLFIFKMFSSGINMSIGFPVFRIGTVIFSALLAILLLKEPVNIKYIIGFLLSLSGFFLIVTSK